MKSFILIMGVFLLVGCKSHKKASAEYDAFLAETNLNSTESVKNTGAKGELSEMSDDNASMQGKDATDQAIAWPGEPSSTAGVENKIVIKEEEATLLHGEDENMAGYKYFVIIGSFANELNARNYKATLAEKGFVPTILENKTGYFRVAVYQSKTEQEARAKIQSIRSKYPEHKDVWLLSRTGM